MVDDVVLVVFHITPSGFNRAVNNLVIDGMFLNFFGLNQVIQHFYGGFFNGGGEFCKRYGP